MSSRSHSAVALWNARHPRSSGDRAFAIYAVVMVALVAIAPIGRAIWLSAGSREGLALLSNGAAPTVTSAAVALMWACALVVGRDRGPAVRAPFVAYALALSDLSRFETFRGPLLRSGGIVVAVSALAAGFVGSILASRGLSDPGSVARFTAVGALVGVITTVAWLVGQAVPRAAVAGALTIVACAALTCVVPALQMYTPWGWAGLSYPTTGSSPFLTALAALAVILACLAPALMNRFVLADLMTHAARWDAAITHAAGMDFSSAATIYQSMPHRGRHVRAVRPHTRLMWTFFLRNVIGATRTPGRLLVSIVALTTAGGLITLALTPGTPGWLLGATAGVIAFLALGPLTDGVRHAATVASDFPIYGISDERLLIQHTLFPLVITVGVLVAVAVTCSVIIGTGAGASCVSALVLGLVALSTRIINALKGPLPISLLSPISTPVGDVMAAVRLVWAFDAVALAALGGAAAAVALVSPLLVLGVGVTIAAVALTRWRGRR